jgi:3,4-dihydroxyphthalate decarboxylase
MFTEPGDIKRVDLDGHGELDDYAVPNELPLHIEVLSARPEVAAVVHAHPPDVVAADLAGLTLAPIIGAFNIPAARLAIDGIAVYPRSVLISRRELAQEMMAAMGQRPVCLLRGHGLTVTGVNLHQAVARALAVNELAGMCLAVARCGNLPKPIPAADMAELPDLGATFNDTLLWSYHAARLAAEGRDVV